LKRILSIDGGGVRGVFSLEILRRIESILAERSGRGSDFVLADHYDFIGGTSTGSIIAAFLSLGRRVEEISSFYFDHAPAIFEVKASAALVRTLFDGEVLARALQKQLDDGTGEALHLGSGRLRTRFAAIARNATRHDTHVFANFSEDGLHLPLWQILRASSATPSFFGPEIIEGDEYVDGGVGAHKNPAFALYLLATALGGGLEWPEGTDELSLTSVGTGRVSARYPLKPVLALNQIDAALHGLRAITDATVSQADELCRLFGESKFGPAPSGEWRGRPSQGRFSYLRYDHRFTEKQEAASCKATRSSKPFGVADLRNLMILKGIGMEYAEATVLPEHLDLV